MMRKRPGIRLRDVPCGSCVEGYDGHHSCDAPNHCACDRTDLHVPFSRLHGATAGRDLHKWDTLIDLDPRDAKVIRPIGEDIPAGAKLEVAADGRVYKAEEEER